MREGVSVAARPVPNQATTRITGFDEHPWIAVDGEDGACSEHDEVARAVDAEVRHVAIAREREIALVGVEEHNTEVFLRFFDGLDVAAHGSIAFRVGSAVFPRSFVSDS